MVLPMYLATDGTWYEGYGKFSAEAPTLRIVAIIRKVPPGDSWKLHVMFSNELERRCDSLEQAKIAGRILAKT